MGGVDKVRGVVLDSWEADYLDEAWVVDKRIEEWWKNTSLEGYIGI